MVGIYHLDEYPPGFEARTRKEGTERNWHVYASPEPRTIWVTAQAIDELFGSIVRVDVDARYGQKGIAFEGNENKRHMLLTIIGKAPDSVVAAPSIKSIWSKAPHNHDQPGRPAIHAETKNIKAVVSTNAAAFLTELGHGNLSQGVRVAIEYAQRYIDGEE